MLFVRNAARSNTLRRGQGSEQPGHVADLAVVLLCLCLLGADASSPGLETGDPNLRCTGFVQNGAFLFAEYELTLHTTSTVVYDWKGSTFGGGGTLNNVAPGKVVLRVLRDVEGRDYIAMDMLTTRSRTLKPGLYRISPGRGKSPVPKASYANLIGRERNLKLGQETDVLIAKGDGDFRAKLYLRIEAAAQGDALK
jgi:hypothetical protein